MISDLTQIAPRKSLPSPRPPRRQPLWRPLVAMFVPLVVVTGLAPTASVRAETAPPAAPQFPVALVSLEPKASEYGTHPDPDGFQTNVGPGKIDTSPVRNNNNAEWFWPKARKIVEHLPAGDFKLPEGQSYNSSMTDVFACEGKFVTGVGLWGRTRNMYHWIDYAIPEGATRFTADVLISDDPFGWMAGLKSVINQQFEFFVTVDGKEVARQGATRLKQVAGGGERLTALNIPLPAAARVIRFNLEISRWGAGNKNVELVINEGTFQSNR